MNRASRSMRRLSGRRGILGLIVACAAVLALGCRGSTEPPPSAIASVGVPAGTVAATQVATPAPPDFVALPGATAHFGTLGKAAYRIEIPDRWNGELVLWAHGFDGFATAPAASNPSGPLRRQFIADGYAWAASSYSETGWVPGSGVDDTIALKRLFALQYGNPGRTYITGTSMGGAVVALSLERYPDEYNGALALCGAVGGEEEIDYLASWWMAAEYFAGARLPIGEGASRVQQALQSQLLPVLGDPQSHTPSGQSFESVIRNLTGGPRPFFEEGYRQDYLANFFLLLFDPNLHLLAGRAATNATTRYQAGPVTSGADDALNAGIRRLAADPSARNAETYPDLAPTTGRIRVPLLMLNDTGDLVVPIVQAVRYREKVDLAGAGALLVQRAIRDAGHCRFREGEVTKAWRDLVAWVTEGKRPAGESLAGDLREVGRDFTQPLRTGDPGTQ